MLNKIKSLGARFFSIEINKKNKLLGDLEKITGTLPNDYREFLFHFGSNVQFDAMVSFKSIVPSPWADKNGFDAIEYFYGLINTNTGYTVFEAINTYRDDFKMKFVPIGFSSGGNQICLCLDEKRKGSIWFWDHETDPTFDPEKIILGLTLIAYDFKSFIGKLTINEDSSPSKAIGGYLDF